MPLRKPFAEESVTVTATATPLTASIYKATNAGTVSNREYPSPPSAGKAEGANVECLTESIYYTLLGGTPTSADHKMLAGDSLILTNIQQIAGFRAVRTAAVDATLAVTYFRG